MERAHDLEKRKGRGFLRALFSQIAITVYHLQGFCETPHTTCTIMYLIFSPEINSLFRLKNMYTKQAIYLLKMETCITVNI